MNSIRKPILCAAILAFGATPSLLAHRQWMLASTTILSGEEQWISVEGAVSNDLFFPNHVAINLERTKVLAPDGSNVELRSATQGKIRSSFELLLEHEGTYKITSANVGMLFASWKEDGETKRWRGPETELAAQGILEKPEVTIGEFSSRVETFVTSGSPSEANLAPSGSGLEIVYLTHPNDLFAGETATFQLLFDGKPAAGNEITLIKGDDRFRDEVGEITLTTDADGGFSVTWTEPGRYWLNTSIRLPESTYQGVPLRRGSSYTVTLEVLPE